MPRSRPVEFVHGRSDKRQGKVFIKPTNTVTAGVTFKQPSTRRSRLGKEERQPGL
jgi:hypothetical protein